MFHSELEAKALTVVPITDEARALIQSFKRHYHRVSEAFSKLRPSGSPVTLNNELRPATRPDYECRNTERCSNGPDGRSLRWTFNQYLSARSLAALLRAEVDQEEYHPSALARIDTGVLAKSAPPHRAKEPVWREAAPSFGARQKLSRVSQMQGEKVVRALSPRGCTPFAAL